MDVDFSTSGALGCSGKLGQYHGCRCPGSLWIQVMSSILQASLHPYCLGLQVVLGNLVNITAADALAPCGSRSWAASCRLLLILTVWGSRLFWETWSISQLQMPWLPVDPGHEQHPAGFSWSLLSGAPGCSGKLGQYHGCRCPSSLWIQVMSSILQDSLDPYCLGSRFFRETWSISWLQMPWLPVEPGHQQPWYWHVYDR